ncbi:energy-coupling factor transporter transmembrane protein EcfT [Roseospira marina]|uniref:Energy-coupling factor transporter transmembrane protein EcfT n=1 Tax=Roseospira marina TaxID=140057 RepID=A0A5M6IEI1_9PROT|nr:energy-coupling factor transporter transmembrane protein EcfT [Roseospira marina]KAA5606125.1 energy-coupling factor transporter transmembrane protein EcfT [Roseospira marina]MBB4314263.1 biotin transport system permease protein [Roseospira marina]MBB5087423.1 biotin transport system permease protein [Roseospira marina]
MSPTPSSESHAPARTRPGRSPLHRMPAGIKLLVLAAAGTGLAFTTSLWVLGGALALTGAGYAIARQPVRRLFGVIRPMIWLLVPIFLVQGFMESWILAVAIVTRIITLVALAQLVTLTTPSDTMIAVITRALTPFRVFGVHPGKVALAISLALRFLPVIGGLAQEVRDAQRARGLGHNPLALALPLLIRTLRMAGDVTDAIEARSGGDDDEDAAPARTPVPVTPRAGSAAASSPAPAPRSS